MRLLFILFLLPSVLNAQILAGYIKAAPSGSQQNACTEGSGMTVAAYTSDGTFTSGRTITNVSGGAISPSVADFDFHAYSNTSGGGVAGWVQIWGDNTSHGTGTCSGGGGGGGSPSTIAWDTTGYIYPECYAFAHSEGRGSYSYPFQTLFNGLANAGGLPRPGLVDRLHRTGYMGISKTRYPDNQGLGYLLDLVKDTNMTDFSKQATVTGFVWREENSFNPKDTIYIYAMDSVFQLSASTAITDLAKASTLLTPLAKLPFSNRSTWDSVTGLSKAVRYLYLRFPTHDSTSSLGVWTFAQPGALKIRGTRYGGAVTTYASLSTAAKGVTTVDSLLGRNQSETLDDTLSYGEGHIRFYTKTFYWDSSHVALGSSLKFTMNYFNDGGYIENYLKRVKAAGKFVWMTIRGASPYLNSRATGGTESTENAVPVSDTGMSPELLSSYGRFAMMTKELARKFGNGSTTDSSHFNNSETVFQGLNKNSMDGIEIGNETEADFNGCATALAYYCWVKNCRDSVDLVDPSFKLIGNGTYYLNKDWYKTYWLFTQLFNNKNFMLYAINYHDYNSRIDSIYLNPLGQVSYHKGATPEWDSCYQRYQDYTNFFLQRVPTLKIFNSEYGLEEGDSTAIVSNPFFTPYSTNKMNGFTIGQSRFGMLYRRELINAASNIYKSTFYSSVNPSYIDFTKYTTGVQNVSTFAQTGVMAGDGSPGGGQHGSYKVESYYLHPFQKKYLSGYKVESVTNIGRDALCLIKFRNVLVTDSVCYAIWWGIDSVNSSHSYGIVTPGLVGTPNKVVPLMDKTDNAVVSGASITGSTINVTADWLPQLFLAKEAVSVNSATQSGHKRKRIVNR